MRWSFVIPGQPPSWNASYQIVKKHGRRGTYMTLAKRERAKIYQDGATLIIRSAKPSKWKPTGQVRVYYYLQLARDIDCDNVMKSIHDAIEEATGVDDKLYLPCVVEKTTGWGIKAQVRVVIEDPASPFADLLGSSTTTSP